VHGPRLVEIDGITGTEIYNVFTIDDGKITHIQDSLDRAAALAAAGAT